MATGGRRKLQLKKNNHEWVMLVIIEFTQTLREGAKLHQFGSRAPSWSAQEHIGPTDTPSI